MCLCVCYLSFPFLPFLSFLSALLTPPFPAPVKFASFKTVREAVNSKSSLIFVIVLFYFTFD